MIDLPSEADGAGPRDEQPGPRDLWGEHSVARRSLGALATAAVPYPDQPTPMVRRWYVATGNNRHPTRLDRLKNRSTKPVGAR
jgi:hypothetical protein